LQKKKIELLNKVVSTIAQNFVNFLLRRSPFVAIYHHYQKKEKEKSGF